MKYKIIIKQGITKMKKKKTEAEYFKYARFQWGAKYILEKAEISIATLHSVINGNGVSQERIINNLAKFRKENPLDE